MLGILIGTIRVAAPEIVWRNPHPVRAHRRRHSFEGASEHPLYIMQEFIEDGQNGYWMTISGLEVVAGGRAA
jgi:hypothetical protein